jgi:hypothetical protein
MSVAPEAGAGGNATLRANQGFAAASVPSEIRPFSNVRRGDAEAWLSAAPHSEGRSRE